MGLINLNFRAMKINNQKEENQKIFNLEEKLDNQQLLAILCEIGAPDPNEVAHIVARNGNNFEVHYTDGKSIVGVRGNACEIYAERGGTDYASTHDLYQKLKVFGKEYDEHFKKYWQKRSEKNYKEPTVSENIQRLINLLETSNSETELYFKG